MFQWSIKKKIETYKELNRNSRRPPSTVLCLCVLLRWMCISTKGPRIGGCPIAILVYQRVLQLLHVTNHHTSSCLDSPYLPVSKHTTADGYHKSRKLTSWRTGSFIPLVCRVLMLHPKVVGLGIAASNSIIHSINEFIYNNHGSRDSLPWTCQFRDLRLGGNATLPEQVVRWLFQNQLLGPGGVLQHFKLKNYFTSSDPHHDMLGGGCQVGVVI